MGLLERIERQQKTENPKKNEPHTVEPHTDHAREQLKIRIHEAVINEINQNKSDVSSSEQLERREQVMVVIDRVVATEADSLGRSEQNRLAEEICHEVIGYGPLEQLLADENVTEIMVNGPQKIYIEKKGKLQRAPIRFYDEAHVMNIIDRIVSSIGRHIDEASPMVDARLADGSRVNAIIPPLSLIGPVITIRKFSKNPIGKAELLSYGSVSHPMLAFLDACVKGKQNVIVSGGTGSGKTTLLNVLSSFIPNDERIVTIEDAAELQLMQEHVITLESRPANLEGKGQISIRQLVKNALRMRPDRIIVGEVRADETLDMLQAMNTGHDGSLTTIHANSPRDSLSRIETMILMAGYDLPLRAIRTQIASAVDLVIQQSRMRDGSRKVTAITEIHGMEGDMIVMQDIFKYEMSGGVDQNGTLIGDFQATGVRPRCMDEIKGQGVPIQDDWFS